MADKRKAPESRQAVGLKSESPRVKSPRAIRRNIESVPIKLGALFRKYHSPGILVSSCDDLIEVDTTRNLATERILAVPNDIVTTRFLGLVDQRSDLLSQYVVNHEVNVLRPTEHVSNRRRRIERVRIVLTQSKSLDLGLDKVLFRHNQSPLRQQRNIDIHVPGEIRRTSVTCRPSSPPSTTASLATLILEAGA